MTHAPSLARPRLNPRLAITMSSTVLLFGAFLFLPGMVSRVWSQGDGITTGVLAETLGAAFSQWWSSSAAPLTPDMEAVVSFWRVFHVTKAVIAGALVVALLLTGRCVWKAYARSNGRAARAAIALLGMVGAPLAPLMLLVVMANVQGAIAPLSSVMGLLPMDGSVPEIAQVRQHFAAGTTTPVLEALISDFRTYHLALAVIAVMAAALVVAADVAVWIRRSRISREDVRLRRVTAMVAAVMAMLAAFLLLLVVLNLSTVSDTAPALAAFFEGSI